MKRVAEFETKFSLNVLAEISAVALFHVHEQHESGGARSQKKARVCWGVQGTSNTSQQQSLTFVLYSGWLAPAWSAGTLLAYLLTYLLT